jgi:hypothetical protein
MWFESKFYQELKEQDEDATLHDCLSEHSLKEYFDDLMRLNITQENYLKLIELCDFLMVTNIDILVDKIVQYFGTHIIYNFGDFYKYNSQRLQVHDKKSLKQAIKLYCEDPEKCYETYGFSAYWNVSNITNMDYMFCQSKFNGDISRWDVSNMTTMISMFENSPFNGDISQWDVSNVEFMMYMFENSPFNGDLSKWKVSNLRGKYNMFKNCPFDDSKLKWKLK